MSQSSLKMRRTQFLAAVFITCVLSGCELFGGDSGKLSELSQQRRIWGNFNSGNYSFVLTRSCFCIYAGEFQIFVGENEIVDIIPPWDDLEGVPEEDWRFFQTIDGIFDVLQEAYSGNADRIDVDYSQYGYPLIANIDYIENAVDDELYLGVSEVRMQF